MTFSSRFRDFSTRHRTGQRGFLSVTVGVVHFERINGEVRSGSGLARLRSPSGFLASQVALRPCLPKLAQTAVSKSGVRSPELASVARRTSAASRLHPDEAPPDSRLVQNQCKAARIRQSLRRSLNPRTAARCDQPEPQESRRAAWESSAHPRAGRWRPAPPLGAMTAARPLGASDPARQEPAPRS